MYVFLFAVWIIFYPVWQTNEHWCKISKNAIVIFNDSLKISFSLRSSIWLSIFVEKINYFTEMSIIEGGRGRSIWKMKKKNDHFFTYKSVKFRIAHPPPPLPRWMTWIHHCTPFKKKHSHYPHYSISDINFIEQEGGEKGWHILETSRFLRL